jgi:ribonucleoside-triphosphate reductase
MYAEGHSFFTYMSDNADSLSSYCRLRNEIQDNGFSYTLGAGGVSTGSKSVLTINLNRCIQHATRKGLLYPFFLEEVVDLMHKVQLAYNENLKYMQEKGMLPLFDAGYINMGRQYLTIGVNGLVEAAEFLGIEINDNPQYEGFVQQVLSIIERCNKKYRTKDVMFNCEMIPAENVGVKHAKWDRRDGYKVGRDCYNSYFYIVEDDSINIVDKFRLHGRKYIEHLTGGSALHMNLKEHLDRNQYRQLLRVASQEGCNYFTFNIPNTVCNDCGHIDKRNMQECPACKSKNLDYLTRIIGYMKRVSNFSQPRQEEAARRHYGSIKNYELRITKNMKKDNVIQEKSFAFAIRVVNLYKFLCEDKKEFVLSKQVLRSGTSIGANIEESIGGQSDKDFFMKITIAYKEARESI